MKNTIRWMKVAFAVAFALGACGFAAPAKALELPLTSVSPLTSVTFDDLPMILPVEQNFQMAMLAVSSELGRSCGKMEAYGWRMNQTEQARVNQIFSGTVDKLRAMDYVVAPETVKSASKDITVFTADRTNKHLMFLWSANDLGLVLTLCETGIPLPSTHSPMTVSNSVQVFPTPIEETPPVSADVSEKTKSRKKAKITKASIDTKKIPFDDFSPTGNWVGSYTCGQGYTGGTLEIDRLHGKDFSGAFRFYATEKSPSVPDGYYTVFGQYDKETKRILINPGKWIRRPKGFYNTVIVGSFDPIKETFSAYFQGITGCTSFEAVRAGSKGASLSAKKIAPAKQAVVKKKKVTKSKSSAAKITSTPTQKSTVLVDDKKDAGIILAPPSVAPTDAVPTTVMPSAASPDMVPLPTPPATAETPPVPAK